jgi:hypothetical protein
VSASCVWFGAPVCVAAWRWLATQQSRSRTVAWPRPRHCNPAASVEAWYALSPHRFLRNRSDGRLGAILNHKAVRPRLNLRFHDISRIRHAPVCHARQRACHAHLPRRELISRASCRREEITPNLVPCNAEHPQRGGIQSPEERKRRSTGRGREQTHLRTKRRCRAAPA